METLGQTEWVFLRLLIFTAKLPSRKVISIYVHVLLVFECFSESLSNEQYPLEKQCQSDF